MYSLWKLVGGLALMLVLWGSVWHGLLCGKCVRDVMVHYVGCYGDDGRRRLGWSG